MKLLLFKLQLAAHLGLFIIKLGANISSKTKPFILGLFTVFLLIAVTQFSIIITKIEPEKTIIESSRVPANSQLFTQKKLSQKELEQELHFWKKVEKKQPHSRDVLLNISQLYSALHLEIESEEYLNKISKIDPNNQLLK